MLHAYAPKNYDIRDAEPWKHLGLESKCQVYGAYRLTADGLAAGASMNTGSGMSA